MKNLKTKVIAASLSALMAISAVSATAVSAAETPNVTKTAAEETDRSTLTRTYYFTDVNDWGDKVYCYTYDNEDGKVIENKGAYPGTPLSKVGTTKLIDGKTHNVYSVKVNVTDDYLCFNDGVKENRNTKMDLANAFRDGANMVYYTKDNYPEVRHFEKSDIRTNENTIYFQNTKNWKDVYVYTAKYAMDSNGQYLKDEKGKEIVLEEPNGAWPGKKLDEVIGSGKDPYAGENRNVYPVSVHEGESVIVFNEGFDHGQQSSNINIQYIWGGANLISLDQSNIGTIGHFSDSFIENLDPAI